MKYIDVMEIVAGGLSDPVVKALLNEHLEEMVQHSPPECVHALDLESLRLPCISFWTAWSESVLLGCAALKELTPYHGEIKSMRTSRDQLKRGVATSLLKHLIKTARQRSYQRISLETGSGPHFKPAYDFYKKFGFEPCDPFSDYRNDPFSRFMKLDL